MPELTFIEAIRSAMADAMAEDPLVFVLGEDVALKGGVFLATVAGGLSSLVWVGHSNGYSSAPAPAAQQ